MDGALAELKTLFFWVLGGAASIFGAVIAWVFNDMNARIKDVGSHADSKADDAELTRVRDDSAELWRSHNKMNDHINERHREQMNAIGQVAEAVARIEGKLSQ